MSRSATLTLLVGIVLAWLCLCGNASALTELCPASLADFGATGAPPTAPATAFGYDLTALTPRTVDAAMVADTDRGWYGWRVSGVVMRAAQLQEGGYQGRGARSAPLEVDFPEPAIVHHAWVADASAPGETIFGWGAAGDAACEVPAYTARDRTQATPSPNAPKPAASAVSRAAPVPAPFAFACATPFVPASVARAPKPILPKDAFTPGDNPAIAIVDVALDERGVVFDAWIAQRAGEVPGFDQSALSAARLGQYRGAVSYCQSVKSIYAVRLDFQSL
ncbi:MAG: hypothetical protein ABI231_02275 [Candidatus Tumulicola sp.]